MKISQVTEVERKREIDGGDGRLTWLKLKFMLKGRRDMNIIDKVGPDYEG